MSTTGSRSRCSTHDAGGLSELDIKLARAIDEIAPERDRRPPLP